MSSAFEMSEEYDAEVRLAALCEAAIAVVALRQMNPINGDCSNSTIANIIRGFDRLAGNDEPSRAAALAWAIRMDKYEADYCELHNIPQATKTHVERLAQA